MSNEYYEDEDDYSEEQMAATVGNTANKDEDSNRRIMANTPCRIADEEDRESIGEGKRRNTPDISSRAKLNTPTPDEEQNLEQDDMRSKTFREANPSELNEEEYEPNGEEYEPTDETNPYEYRRDKPSSSKRVHNGG